MDDPLATHFAHLWLHDPLIVFAKDLNPDSPGGIELYESFQATTGNPVRFKPPSSRDSNDDGWRLEFRPMEVQFTDLENAAFAIFIMLLARTMLHFDLNLYMSMSLIEENMEKAHIRDAIACEKFHFRTNPFLGSKMPPRTEIVDSRAPTADHNPYTRSPRTNGVGEDSPVGYDCEDSVNSEASTAVTSPSGRSDTNNQASHPSTDVPNKRALSPDAPASPPTKRPRLMRPPKLQPEIKPQSIYSLQSISSIINGNSENDWPGFVSLIKRYLDETDALDTEARAKVDRYLALIASRASGKSWTAAKWQRDFVRNHRDYKKDSVVGESIVYDMLQAVKKMEDPALRKEVAGKMFEL